MNSTPFHVSINGRSRSSRSSFSNSSDIVNPVNGGGTNNELFERVMPSAVLSGPTVSMSTTADLQASPIKPNNGSCGEAEKGHQKTSSELMPILFHAAVAVQQQQSSRQSPYHSSPAAKECGTQGTSSMTPSGVTVARPEISTSNSNIDGITSPPIDALVAAAVNKNQLSQSPRPNVFHGKGSFPLNLTLMLESVESMNLGHVVSWLPSGESFVIHDPDKFLSEVLSKFFKSSKNTKIRSFYRKLNRWGFSILRGNHLQHQLAVAGMRGLISGASTKGVWNHPDFYRSRAVECLKNALETGDAGCFLTVSPSGAQGVAGTEGTTRKKSNGSNVSPSLTASLTESTNTAGSTELPSLYFGSRASHRESDFSRRASHRESDFSVGDESTDDLFLSQIAAQQAARSTAVAQQQQASTAAAYGAPRTSYAYAVPPPIPLQASSSANMMDNSLSSSVNYNSANFNYQPARQADAMGGSPRMARRQSQSICSSFSYQPVRASGAMGGNSQRNCGGRNQTGLSASWTAGSTFSQNDIDFPSPYTFNNFNNASPNSTNGPLQEGEEIDEPLPFANNGNVPDMMRSFTAMGQQQPMQDTAMGQHQPMQETQEQGEEFTVEDMELANFFEKFADSLQK